MRVTDLRLRAAKVLRRNAPSLKVSLLQPLMQGSGVYGFRL